MYPNYPIPILASRPVKRAIVQHTGLSLLMTINTISSIHFSCLWILLGDLALQFVKRIEYVCWPVDGDDYPELPYQRDLTANDMRLLRRAVQNAGFQGDKEERIINMLMQTKLNHDLGYVTPEGCRVWKFGITPAYITQAIVAIIVSMSPNLETMAMTQPFLYYIELEEGEEWAKELPLVELFRQANSRPEETRFLQKLRDVYLINRGDRISSDGRYYVQSDLIACLELFNKLPSIESFGIDAFEPDENNGKQTCEDASSNISKIKINHSSLYSSYLLCVMASCKTLTELQYTTGGRASLDGGYPMFNPKAFIKGLAAHKRTLKVLDIDTEQFTSSYPGEAKSQYSFAETGTNMEAPVNSNLTFTNLMISTMMTLSSRCTDTWRRFGTAMHR
ncbi:hypothetical protein PMG11_08077 [Penicillium brasilianum]|uniref:Uncharacterized protein n=1 Tax=Penicillium brasilianum TaxID=104259 RepID=A0A0F7TWP3_PENBI|nr:hypothetical protein PMG11_08077 [Penicillium brasilianum]